MSLMIVAPAATAASAVSALRVSMETRPCAARASMTGRTRRCSSAVSTGSAPGRVDSPPTSTMAAPAANRSRPWATARAWSNHRPPSEKESGVTLTTPMTCAFTKGQGYSARPVGPGPAASFGPFQRWRSGRLR